MSRPNNSKTFPAGSRIIRSPSPIPLLPPSSCPGVCVPPSTSRTRNAAGVAGRELGDNEARYDDHDDEEEEEEEEEDRHRPKVVNLKDLGMAVLPMRPGSSSSSGGGYGPSDPGSYSSFVLPPAESVGLVRSSASTSGVSPARAAEADSTRRRTITHAAKGAHRQRGHPAAGFQLAGGGG
eukprot:CAMPEP_0197544850 /NCGR_PEP_ID=MMETSP1320-20131121/134_1 /TAXON_ID=91990 /ORGANISM="Bolidomonas sp., Strain RCC2347" /LENGTH=179 /DNA_ID=CAMNT_0043104297 /DNA_START=214 /DNA_END=750 /DNA_ORIENTATION=+